MKHKKQHYIPQCYLKAWCDPNTPEGYTPYVWQFEKESREGKRKAPENIFYEKEMYTISSADGARNLVLEHGLAELESKFCDIRDEKITKREPLTATEYFTLCAFVAAMELRTKAMREHHATQWSRIAKVMEEMTEWAKTATEEQKRSLAVEPPMGNHDGNISHDDVKRIASNPTVSFLLPFLPVATDLYWKLMDMAIIETQLRPGFITSDAPCVKYDPEAYKRPPLLQNPGLAYPSVEITLPISPRHMILLNRQGFSGYRPLAGAKEISVVNEFNRRTRFSAHDYYVVNENVTDESWFDPGIEPEDSWGKTHKDGMEDCELL